LCELTDSSFVCSLCGRSTDIKSLTVWHNNYCRYPAARQHLPELQQQVYEVLVDPEPQEAAAATHDQQVRRTAGDRLSPACPSRPCLEYQTSMARYTSVHQSPSVVRMPHITPALLLLLLYRLPHGCAPHPNRLPASRLCCL
jgi:hypothetical protein